MHQVSRRLHRRPFLPDCLIDTMWEGPIPLRRSRFAAAVRDERGNSAQEELQHDVHVVGVAVGVRIVEFLGDRDRVQHSQDSADATPDPVNCAMFAAARHDARRYNAKEEGDGTPTVYAKKHLHDFDDDVRDGDVPGAYHYLWVFYCYLTGVRARF